MGVKIDQAGYDEPVRGVDDHMPRRVEVGGDCGYAIALNENIGDLV